MSYRNIEMFEYRHIIYLMRSGLSDRAISQQGYAGRHKCQTIRVIAKSRGWLQKDTPLPTESELSETLSTKPPVVSGKSTVDTFREKVLDWHQQGVRATVIYQALVNRHHYKGSYDSIRRFIKKHATPTIKASTPLSFEAAEAAQVDFGTGPTITDDDTGEISKTWIFVMTLCFSRHMYVEMVRNQTVITWLGCHRRAFEFFGGVPTKMIIDNAKCAIVKACIHNPEVQRSYADCAEHYGFIISPCPPRQPQMKGRVESGVKYVKGSFVPLRKFTSLADANAQARAWVLGEAGNRNHGTTYQKPLSLFSETEQHLLKMLPDQPYELAQWAKVKVHGDCHVQFMKNRYSVPWTNVRETLWLRATETSVKIYKDHDLIAQHVRLQIPGKRSTITGHLPPNGQAHLMQDPAWCLAQSKDIGASCEAVIKHLFEDKVLDNLRSAQGIVRLAKTYGNQRLEAACHRAIAYSSCNYKTIKNILKKGCEYKPLPNEEAFDLLASAYTNGKFIRSNKTDTKH
jgi:transposase